MTVTIYAADTSFAASSGSNIDVTPSYSYFDHPPNSTTDLTITSNVGDTDPSLFEVGETYDLTWSGHGGGIMEDATIIRSDYLGPGQGAIVFEGINSVNGEAFQLIWTPGFDVEQWYWDNGGGPSSPNAFYTSDQNATETYQAVCFASGTYIDTADGPAPVENLQAGDMVSTLDHGFAPIRWIRHDEQPLEEAAPDAKPVLVTKGALGSGRPHQDLIVSPQHRLLVGEQGQLSTVFRAGALVPAKSLTALQGIRHMKGKKRVTWVHFACDRHEIVVANGCLCESLLLGPMVVKLLTAKQKRAVTAIFGQARTDHAALNGPPARECLKVGKVQRLLHSMPDGTSKAIQDWDDDLNGDSAPSERPMRSVAVSAFLKVL